MSNPASTKTSEGSMKIVWALVGFAAITLVVNATFVFVATKTHRGLAVEHAYEKGLRYNEVLAATEAQAALGWKESVSVFGRDLRVVLHDKSGQSITDAKVTARVRRPVTNEQDTTLEMVMGKDGQYHVAKAMPDKGAWDVFLQAERGEDHFRARHVVVVKE